MTQQSDSLWFCDPSDQAAYRQAEIAKAAYFRAPKRGFAPGHDLEDWLAAEHEEYRLPAHDGAPLHLKVAKVSPEPGARRGRSRARLPAKT
jgi:hypothetical protein